MDEAETGLKSSLAVKIFGPRPRRRSRRRPRRCSKVDRAGARHHATSRVVRELGQPSLTIEPDRAKIARYGLNVADINTLIETAVGGAAATQVIQGERSVRPRGAAPGAVPPEHGGDPATCSSRRRTASTCRCGSSPTSGSARGRRSSTASRNSRFIGIQFSVEGRDLASAVARGAGAGGRGGAAADRLHLRLGRRVQGVPGGAASR